METGIVKLSSELLSILSGDGKSNGGIMPFKREIFVLNENISGTSYCESIAEIFPKLKENTYLTVKRDPNNEHDSCAIGVYFDSTRIGWVPMKENTVISRLMDAGKAFTCKVVKTSIKGTWHVINVSLYMVD